MNEFKIGDKVRIKTESLKNRVDQKQLAHAIYEGVKLEGAVANIRKVSDGTNIIRLDSSRYYWSEESLEMIKDKVKTVDIGYHLEYCGHQIIENVYYGGYAHDNRHVFCTTVDGANQYTFPIESIDFIVPHEATEN